MLSRKETHSRRRPEQKIGRSRGLSIAGSVVILVCAAVLIARFGLPHFHADGPDQTSAPDTVATAGPSAASSAAVPGTGQADAKAAQPSSVATSTPVSSNALNPAPPTGAQDRVNLAFVGDVLLGSTVTNLLKQNGYDYPYQDVKTLLQKADLTIANLETPVTDRGVAQTKEYVYRSSPQTLPAFKEAGFDIVNLANNHVMDYGQDGLLDTFRYLDEAGIKRIGAGKDAEEAYKPVIVETKGIRIAFLGFSRVVPETSWKAGKNHPGVAETYDYRPPVEAIQQARKQADLVVVFVHWGDDPVDKPNDIQTSLAKRYIDAGADLIVGSHPHVLQSFESYKGKWIAYSLGNFIFTTNDNAKTLDSTILEAACGRDGKCDLHVVPIYTKDAKPVPMSEDAGKALLDRLRSISIRTRVEPDGSLLPVTE